MGVDVNKLKIGLPHKPCNRIPVFLKREAFIILLEMNPDPVLSWGGAPSEKWFSGKQGDEFTLGLFGFCEERGYMTHSNGRHRTRWLIQQGLRYIPIYVFDSSYYDVFRSGAIHRRAFYGEPIRISSP